MKYLLSILICLSLFISCSGTPKYDPGIEKKEPVINQPDGFLNYKWGEKENIFSKRECNFDVENSKIFYELSAYKCYDTKTVDGVTGFEYRLYYYRDQFFMGSLYFHKSHVDNLVKNLYVKYGPPTKKNTEKDILNLGKQMYVQWITNKILVMVEYSPYDNRAKLSYIFLPPAVSLNYRLDQEGENPLFEE